MDPALLALIVVIAIVASGLAATSAWLNQSRRQQSPGAHYQHAPEPSLFRDHPEFVRPGATGAAGKVEQRRLRERWAMLEQQFVRDPRGAVLDADEFVGELMRRQDSGAPPPGAGIERSSRWVEADRSRERARAAVTRNGQAEQNTEALREAMLEYAGAVDALLDLRAESARD
jgi:hypothetical protein